MRRIDPSDSSACQSIMHLEVVVSPQVKEKIYGQRENRRCPTTRKDSGITPRQTHRLGKTTFGDTRLHANARVSTRSSSASISNLHRHTKLLRKSRRGELANPGVLISWVAGHINAILTLYVRAWHASNEGATA
jgi:hypothetical protein